MSTLELLVRTPAATALGWTVVHSLWEGALAALLVAAILIVVPSPRVRCACAYTALLVMLAAFGFTFARVMPRQAAGLKATPLAIPRALLGAGDLFTDPFSQFRLSDVPPWLAPFWMVGVLLFQMRTAAGWMAVRRLRRRGVCRPPDVWVRRLEELRARLQVSKPVVLLESCMADVPVVIGYLRPVVLAPVGMLSGMPPNQVDAILLHELAHIRRHDCLANAVQSVVEGLLFYHPAVWWISRVLRTERENCCDDLVVAASGNAHAYATALTALEESRSSVNQAALAATGGSLMKRIRRLLDQPKNSALAPLFSAGLLIVAISGAMAAWQAKPAPQPPPLAHVSPYTQWLDESVVYIIDDRERAAFLALKTDEERDKFIEQFWERRNPNPGSWSNFFKIEHYRRMGYANGHFGWRATPGWKTDRGRLCIVYGPPDEIEFHPNGRPAMDHSPATSVPTETWRYHTLKGIGTNVIMEFVDPARSGEFKMTEDPNPGGRVAPRP